MKARTMNRVPQIVLFALTTAVLGLGPAFEMPRESASGGGVVRSTGEEFELSGTVGQPGAGAMTGDQFTLTGGFWVALAKGDCNEDGLLNLLDHADMVVCLEGPDAEASTNCGCFDVDQSGSVDLRDFALVQR